jgi:site-specific DNA-cytosine methylase
LDNFTYRIYPFESKNVREGAAIPCHWPSVDPKRLTAIDLFAGCGGMSAGLQKAGFQNLLAVEWDASCCATFQTNISPRILQCAIQEVETFPLCDLLVGGPPCQGASPKRPQAATVATFPACCPGCKAISLCYGERTTVAEICRIPGDMPTS